MIQTRIGTTKHRQINNTTHYHSERYTHFVYILTLKLTFLLSVFGLILSLIGKGENLNF